MLKRPVNTNLLAMLMLALAGFGSVATLLADEPPNVIVIMADDLGYGGLGCYGQEQIATPNLDRLAAQGMRFTQAYAGAHVCQPSRSVLMTGQHTGHTACRANNVNQYLWAEDVTVAEVLQQSGYATGLFGKWGLGYEGSEGHPLEQGFDRFYGQLYQVHAHFYYPAWLWDQRERSPLAENVGGGRGQYVADEIHRRGLAFIRNHHDTPFFAYFPSIIPHVELVVPEASEAPYRGRFPKRAILDPRRGYLGSEDGLATFAGMISHLDGHVGEVMSLLDELGIADETILIFTSDNGGQNGGIDNAWSEMNDYFRANGDLRGYKNTFYEGGIRVPLIVRWPKLIEPGITTDYVCGFQDLLPTLAEVAGVDAPAAIDGRSLLPVLRGETIEEPRWLYWEYPIDEGLGRAARLGDWKIVQPAPGAPFELYDLINDPGESANLASQEPDRVEAMVQAMDAAHVPARTPKTTVRRPTLDDFVW